MTNYNERLDEILGQYAKRVENIPSGKTYGWSDEKQAIISLFKELVAEAKPELPALFAKLDDISVIMYKKGTDEFEQNLLKALSNNGEAE